MYKRYANLWKRSKKRKIQHPTLTIWKALKHFIFSFEPRLNNATTNYIPRRADVARPVIKPNGLWQRYTLDGYHVYRALARVTKTKRMRNLRCHPPAFHPTWLFFFVFNLFRVCLNVNGLVGVMPVRLFCQLGLLTRWNSKKFDSSG